MLRDLLKFEFSLQFRQVGFWVTLSILVLIGILAGSADWLTVGSEGGERIKANGTYTITNFVGAISALTMFFAAVFVVTGLLRDDLHASLEVVHSTPVATRDMVLSRAIVALVTTILVSVAAVLGYALGQYMPWADAEIYGPFRLSYYLQPTVLFIVCNAILVTGLYVLVAMTTRSRALVWVAAVGLFIVSSAIDGILTAQAPDWARALLEPFGSGAYVQITEFWTPVEKNTSLVPVMNLFGLNRILALLIGLGLFGVGVVAAKRGILMRRTKKGKGAGDAPPAPERVAPVAPRFGLGHTVMSILRRTRFEYLATVKTIPVLVLVLLSFAIFGLNAFLGDIYAPSRTMDTSQSMADLAVGSFGLTLFIVLVFFGADIIWRDRHTNMHRIVDATPVSSAALLVSKWGALALFSLTLVLLSLVMGFVFHAITGETSAIARTFLGIGVLQYFVQFFFLGMLVMFVQNFAPNRVIGMVMGAAVLVGLMFFLDDLPFYHPLMRFGNVSPGSYSEMAGWGGLNGYGMRWAYWMGFVVLLAVVSYWMWRRGTEAGVMGRLRGLPKRINMPSAGIAVASLIAFIGAGTLMYQDYEANDYLNSDQREAAQAEYETFVADRYERPTPRITSVSVDAVFRPSERTGLFEGRYTIDNPHEEPIARVFASSGGDADNLELRIEGASQVTGEDFADRLLADYDIYEFAFSPPLQPGETREVTFTKRYDAPTLTQGSNVRSNGTFINNRNALVRFGGLEGGFLQDPDTRRKYELGPRKKAADRDDPEARRYHILRGFSGYADLVDFDARVCTEAGQVPIAPGKFIRAYEEDGLSCREYEAINPIHNFFSFLTADYDVAEDVWEGPDGQSVDLQIYYHPEHDYNIDTMMTAAKTAFDVFTETFSPYQYAQLRIMEFPNSGFAQAFAGTVPFSENIGFVQDPGSADDPKTVDYASYVTIHEIGHQWFAHQVVGADTKGSNLLSEGLTDYASMLAYEELYGFAKARRMLEVRAIPRYLTSRGSSAEAEPVLAKSDGEGWLDYSKTNWVTWGMRGLMGADEVEESVRRFLNEYRATNGAPYPTTLELLDVFREEIDPRYHELIEDYWNRITLWELSFDADPTVTEVGEGRWQVTVPIALDKLYASEEDGEETSATEMDGRRLDEFVVVGLYIEDPEDSLGSDPAHQEIVRVDAKTKTVTLEVGVEPTHVVLDPHRFLIERKVDDNVAELQAATLGASGAN